MPRAKVQHALVNVKANGQDFPAPWMRGSIIDISQVDFDRLSKPTRPDSTPAVVAADAELVRPGLLTGLRESPSDEEVIMWVAAAAPSEIAAVLDDRPMLRDRIMAAAEHLRVKAEFTATPITTDPALVTSAGTLIRDPALPGNLQEIGSEPNLSVPLPAPSDPTPEDGAEDNGGPDTGGVEGTTDDPDAPAPLTAPPVPAGGTDGADNGSDGAPTPGEPDATEADMIVVGNVDDVADYLSDNPQMADSILAAEQRRADRLGKEVRSGVVRAAQAAAGYTAN